MDNTLQLLLDIWNRSEGMYVFLPIKDHGAWVEPPATEVADAELWLGDIVQFEEQDRYFTPARFNGDRRIPENHGRLGVLYADLDGQYDREAFDKIPPTLWWETSPGMEQAIWFLEHPLEPDDALELNRKLSFALSADHGSWIPTKVLRIPGTINYKRGGIEGRLLKYDSDLKYTPEEIEEAVSPFMETYSPTLSTEGGHPEIPTRKQWQELLNKWWPKIDHKTRTLLLSASVSDRSLHLTRLANALWAISMSPQEIFGTLYFLSTNKFYGRPETLWNSVVLPAVTK